MPAFIWAQQSDRNNFSSGLDKEGYSLFNNSSRFGMEMGSSFATGFRGTSMFTQTLSPHLQFQPGQNFSLTVGTLFSTSTFGGSSPVMYGGSGEVMPDRMNAATVYAFGAYQLNPRLTLTGGAWTERNNMNQMYGQMNPQAFDMNARGMMMGMEYRITENLSFGAEVGVSRGYNPFNPYSSGFGHQPMSPFQRRHPW